MDQVNFQDIIQFAVAREKEAVEFYEGLQKIVTNKAAVEALKELAQHERNHVAILNRFKPEDAERFEPENIQNLKLSDFMVETEPGPDSTFQEIMVIAMKREEAAKNLYAQVAKRTEDKAMQDMFLMLADQEAKHKLTLEQYYEDNLAVEM